jgi:hypothetical protein
VDFTIDYNDPSGNQGTTVSTTTNGSTVIYDRTNPVIANASVNKAILPVPNHKMEDILVSYEVRDQNSVSKLVSVTSNEPENGLVMAIPVLQAGLLNRKVGWLPTVC